MQHRPNPTGHCLPDFDPPAGPLFINERGKKIYFRFGQATPVINERHPVVDPKIEGCARVHLTIRTLSTERRDLSRER